MFKSSLTALLLSFCFFAGCTQIQSLSEPEEYQPTVTPRPAGELKTFFIRVDGGNASQCNGEADLPYPGNGINLDCAWEHPFRALPPGETPFIQGGDTIIIQQGSYPMGFAAVDGLEPDTCHPDYPWDYVLPPIPSCLDSAHPTRILGTGWDQSCSQPPECVLCPRYRAH